MGHSERLLWRTLSPRGPSLAAQFTLSRLTAIHLVPQGTLSRLTAIHLVPQGTLSCEAIHLVNTSLYARRQHPSAIAPASPQGAYFWCSTFAHPWARAADGPVKVCRLSNVRLSMLASHGVSDKPRKALTLRYRLADASHSATSRSAEET